MNRPRKPRQTAQDGLGRIGEARVVPPDLDGATGRVGVPSPGGCFVGIDPGFSGAVAFVHSSGLVSVEPAPTIRRAGEKPTFDRRAMVRLLGGATIVFAAVERVNAAPMRGRVQGTTSMFRFGSGYGLWIGILEALGIPYVEVLPRRWKKSILKGIGTGKEAAIRYVEMFHPSVDLKPGRCKTPQDGLAEAVCLAEYARRTWRERDIVGAAGRGPAAVRGHGRARIIRAKAGYCPRCGGRLVPDGTPAWQNRWVCPDCGRATSC